MVLAFGESPSALLSFVVPPVVAAVAAAGFRAERVFDVALCAAVGGWIPFTWWLVAAFGGTPQGTVPVVMVSVAWSVAFLTLTGLLSWGAATSGRALRSPASP
ncbi:MAG: hypothetical protein WD557_12870 [Dehalococcoidia bacterium]